MTFKRILSKQIKDKRYRLEWFLNQQPERDEESVEVIVDCPPAVSDRCPLLADPPLPLGVPPPGQAQDFA